MQVLVTIRRRTSTSATRTSHFIQLPLLDDDILREIYRRHIEVLHEGVEVLSPAALDLLAQGANGQVGMFLKMCRDLFRWGYQQGMLQEADVTRFIDHQLRQLRLTPEAVSFMPAIEQAIREGRLSVRIDDDLQETPLLHSLPPRTRAEGRCTCSTASGVGRWRAARRSDRGGPLGGAGPAPRPDQPPRAPR